MKRLAGLVLLVACGGHSKPPAPPPPPPPDPCAQMADHVVSLMSAAKKADPEDIDPFRQVLLRHCHDDKWSAEATKCLLDIQTLDQGDRCEAMMSKDQAEALEKDGRETARRNRHKEAKESEEKADEDDSAVRSSAPPPPPAPPAAQPAPSGTRGMPKGHKTGDPCEGGQ